MSDTKVLRCWICGHLPRIDDDGDYTRYAKYTTMVACGHIFCPNEKNWKTVTDWNAFERIPAIIQKAKDSEAADKIRHERWAAEEFLKSMGFNEWADRKQVLDYCLRMNKTVFEVSKTAIYHYFPGLSNET